MNQKIKILKTELKQNPWHLGSMMIFSFVLGLFVIVGSRAYQKIVTLVTPIHWSADMVIMPKGLSLEDLVTEMKSGKTERFLPLAIYDTTVGIVSGKVNLSAILTLKENEQPIIQFKGEEGLGWEWAKSFVNVRNWQEQDQYNHPDWGKNLISAFFAKGTYADLNRLYEVIQGKTVAQAFWIQDVVAAAEKYQARIMNSLIEIALIFVLMIALGVGITTAWFFSRFHSTKEFLFELGLSPKEMRSIFFILYGMSLLPSLIGILVGLKLQL